MLIYNKIYNNFLNFLNINSSVEKQNFIIIMRLYKWFYSNNLVSFYNFSELYYILQKFNNKPNILTDLFIYLFNSKRIVNFNVIFNPLLKNNKLLYFFNIVKIQNINVILNKIKSIKTFISLTIKTDFIVRYSPTNVSKYLHTNYLKLVEVLYLRKNKVFNKGRYSRNRQFYRTGVYWCLYINIIAIVGLYFWFYRFVMNFGYLWWLLYLSLASFILAKSLNYGLLNPNNLVKSILSDLNLILSIFSSFISFLVSTLTSIFKKITNSSLNLKSSLAANTLNINLLFIKTCFNYFYQFDTSFKLFSCNVINYYIYSITLNYNRVFLNTNKYKFTSMFTREWEQIEL